MKRLLPFIFIIIGIVLVIITVIDFKKDTSVNTESISNYLEKKYNKKFSSIKQDRIYYIDTYGNIEDSLDTIDEDKYITNYIYTAKDENNISFYIRRVVGLGKEGDYLENYVENGYYDNYVNAYLNDKLLFKIKYDYSFPFDGDVSLFTEDYAPLFDTNRLLNKDSFEMSINDYKSDLDMYGLCLVYRVGEGISVTDLQNRMKKIVNYIVKINGTDFNPNIVIVYNDNNYLFFNAYAYEFYIRSGKDYLSKEIEDHNLYSTISLNDNYEAFISMNPSDVIFN